MSLRQKVPGERPRLVEPPLALRCFMYITFASLSCPGFAKPQDECHVLLLGVSLRLVCPYRSPRLHDCEQPDNMAGHPLQDAALPVACSLASRFLS